jgi:NADP-dependent alcohol dehydrogenase
MPATLKTLRTQKQEKLLQYAERVWGLTIGSTDEKVSGAIAKTESFFHSLLIKTRLQDYDISVKDLDVIIASLEKHRMVALGERANVNLEISQKILLAAEPG